MFHVVYGSVLLVACLQIATAFRGFYDGTTQQVLVYGGVAFAVVFGLTIVAAPLAARRRSTQEQPDAAEEQGSPPDEAGGRLDIAFLLLTTATGAATVALNLDVLPGTGPVVVAMVALLVATLACAAVLFVRADPE